MIIQYVDESGMEIKKCTEKTCKKQKRPSDALLNRVCEDGEEIHGQQDAQEGKDTIRRTGKTLFLIAFSKRVNAD